MAKKYTQKMSMSSSAFGGGMRGLFWRPKQNKKKEGNLKCQ